MNGLFPHGEGTVLKEVNPAGFFFNHACRPIYTHMGAIPDGQMEVKDTANITRKKAQLPQKEQLEHPAPVGGSWLKNRYIVNNFILLEPLGTGSYAEVSTPTYRNISRP